jgi:ACS family tartrate transporter-like MFS transporter
MQFYCVRFGLGLAEAGFFPGVIVFLTHWFPNRDRSRAVALFLIATPVAQIVSPKISNLLLQIGTDEVINGVTVHHPELLGLEGWQWMYIFWGVPAVLLGFVVLYMLPDRPREAKWLANDEREALEQQLELEKAQRSKGKRMSLGEALRNPKVLLLALAFCCSVTANYGYEFFFPSILKSWYKLDLNEITWLVILPPCLALGSQLFVGWNSDRTGERRCHAAFSIIIGLVALGLAPLTQGNLALTILCFMIFFAGVKGYQPAFWALPSLFLTESAAAGSIGLINSIGQIGGFMGPYLLGSLEKSTGSFATGIYVLTASMTVSAVIILSLGLGHRPSSDQPKT